MSQDDLNKRPFLLTNKEEEEAMQLLNKSETRNVKRSATSSFVAGHQYEQISIKEILKRIREKNAAVPKDDLKSRKSVFIEDSESYFSIELPKSGLVDKKEFISPIYLPTAFDKIERKIIEKVDIKKSDETLGRDQQKLIKKLVYCTDKVLFERTRSKNNQSGLKLNFGLSFNSEFECGNLFKAESIIIKGAPLDAPEEYDLYLNEDISLDPNHPPINSWFFFRIDNTKKKSYKFNICNFNRPIASLQNGLRPVMISEADVNTKKRGWKRVGRNITFTEYVDRSDPTSRTKYKYSFVFDLEHSKDRVYFALDPPYSYTQLMNMLYILTKNPMNKKNMKTQLLCRSLAGNRCDMVIITQNNSDKKHEEEDQQIMRSRSGSVIRRSKSQSVDPIGTNHFRSSDNIKNSDSKNGATFPALSRSLSVHEEEPELRNEFSADIQESNPLDSTTGVGSSNDNLLQQPKNVSFAQDFFQKAPSGTAQSSSTEDLASMQKSSFLLHGLRQFSQSTDSRDIQATGADTNDVYEDYHAYLQNADQDVIPPGSLPEDVPKFLLKIQNRIQMDLKLSKDSIRESQRKQVIVIVARYHPADCSSSWMCEGIIKFLLAGSKSASLLRENFIFYIIPMLNPDGVVNGHSVHDISGTDMYRKWKHPKEYIHPTMYHLKKLLRDLKRKYLVVGFFDIGSSLKKQGLFMSSLNPVSEPGTQCYQSKLLQKIDRHADPRSFFLAIAKRNSGVSLRDCSLLVPKKDSSSAKSVIQSELDIPFSISIMLAPSKASQSLVAADYAKFGCSFCLTLADIFPCQDKSLVEAPNQSVNRMSSILNKPHPLDLTSVIEFVSNMKFEDSKPFEATLSPVSMRRLSSLSPKSFSNQVPERTRSFVIGASMSEAFNRKNNSISENEAKAPGPMQNSVDAYSEVDTMRYYSDEEIFENDIHNVEDKIDVNENAWENKSDTSTVHSGEPYEVLGDQSVEEEEMKDESKVLSTDGSDDKASIHPSSMAPTQSSAQKSTVKLGVMPTIGESSPSIKTDLDVFDAKELERYGPAIAKLRRSIELNINNNVTQIKSMLIKSKSPQIQSNLMSGVSQTPPIRQNPSVASFQPLNEKNKSNKPVASSGETLPHNGGTYESANGKRGIISVNLQRDVDAYSLLGKALGTGRGQVNFQFPVNDSLALIEERRDLEDSIEPKPAAAEGQSQEMSLTSPSVPMQSKLSHEKHHEPTIYRASIHQKPSLTNTNGRKTKIPSNNPIKLPLAVASTEEQDPHIKKSIQLEKITNRSTDNEHVSLDEPTPGPHPEKQEPDGTFTNSKTKATIEIKNHVTEDEDHAIESPAFQESVKVLPPKQPPFSKSQKPLTKSVRFVDPEQQASVMFQLEAPALFPGDLLRKSREMLALASNNNRESLQTRPPPPMDPKEAKRNLLYEMGLDYEFIFGNQDSNARYNKDLLAEIEHQNRVNMTHSKSPEATDLTGSSLSYFRKGKRLIGADKNGCFSKAFPLRKPLKEGVVMFTHPTAQSSVPTQTRRPNFLHRHKLPAYLREERRGVGAIVPLGQQKTYLEYQMLKFHMHVKDAFQNYHLPRQEITPALILKAIKSYQKAERTGQMSPRLFLLDSLNGTGATTTSASVEFQMKPSSMDAQRTGSPDSRLPNSFDESSSRMPGLSLDTFFSIRNAYQHSSMDSDPSSALKGPSPPPSQSPRDSPLGLKYSLRSNDGLKINRQILDSREDSSRILQQYNLMIESSVSLDELEDGPQDPLEKQVEAAINNSYDNTNVGDAGDHPTHNKAPSWSWITSSQVTQQDGDLSVDAQPEQSHHPLHIHVEDFHSLQPPVPLNQLLPSRNVVMERHMRLIQQLKDILEGKHQSNHSTMPLGTSEELPPSSGRKEPTKTHSGAGSKQIAPRNLTVPRQVQLDVFSERPKKQKASVSTQGPPPIHKQDESREEPDSALRDPSGEAEDDALSRSVKVSDLHMKPVASTTLGSISIITTSNEPNEANNAVNTTKTIDKAQSSFKKISNRLKIGYLPIMKAGNVLLPERDIQSHDHLTFSDTRPSDFNLLNPTDQQTMPKTKPPQISKQPLSVKVRNNEIMIATKEDEIRSVENQSKVTLTGSTDYFKGEYRLKPAKPDQPKPSQRPKNKRDILTTILV